MRLGESQEEVACLKAQWQISQQFQKETEEKFKVLERKSDQVLQPATFPLFPQEKEETPRIPVLQFQGQNGNLASEHTQNAEISAQGTPFIRHKLAVKNLFCLST